MSSRQVISVAVAPVYKEASFTSEMVTQGLMLETVFILEQKDKWYQVRMDDEYVGWIQAFYLFEALSQSTNNFILTNRYTPLRSTRGTDGQIMALLSFGTVVPILENTSGYCKIQLINDTVGFIPAQNNVGLNCRDEIIRLASSLMGTPYLWGGKSSFGYDCSGFVQMVLKTVGILLPRDASQQARYKKLEKISIEETEPGDLMFFSENNRINHVAFMVGEGKILHCSGEVKLESIIEGETEFNNTLAQLDHTFRSIDKLVGM